MVALIVFTIATLEIVFGRKILLEAKGLFGDNVIRIRLEIQSANRRYKIYIQKFKVPFFCEKELNHGSQM